MPVLAEGCSVAYIRNSGLRFSKLGSRSRPNFGSLVLVLNSEVWVLKPRVLVSFSIINGCLTSCQKLIELFLRDIQKVAAVTKQDKSLKSVVMDYLAFINSPLAHDSDSWNEVMRNPVYSTLRPLFDKIFSPAVRIF